MVNAVNISEYVLGTTTSPSRPDGNRCGTQARCNLGKQLAMILELPHHLLSHERDGFAVESLAGDWNLESRGGQGLSASAGFTSLLAGRAAVCIYIYIHTPLPARPQKA